MFVVVRSSKFSGSYSANEVWISIDDIRMMVDMTTDTGTIVLLIWTTGGGVPYEVPGTSSERMAMAIHEIRTKDLPFLRV